MQYLSFCDSLISLSIMSSRFIHVVTKARFPSFLWLNIIPTYIPPGFINALSHQVAFLTPLLNFTSLTEEL